MIDKDPTDLAADRILKAVDQELGSLPEHDQQTTLLLVLGSLQIRLEAAIVRNRRG